jgi:two-component system, sensor histidine kinase and response regulator
MGDSSKTKACLAAELNAAHQRIAELKSELDVLRIKPCEGTNMELLRAVLDSVTSGILAVDQKGQVIFANKQFAHMWHIPPDLMEDGDDNELLEFVVDQLIDPEKFLKKVRELYASTRDDHDMLRFRDGRVFLRDSQALAVGDLLIGRVWCFTDVSQLVRTEERG